MKKYIKNIRIAEWLGKSFMDKISKEEKREMEEWLHGDPNRRNLVREVLNEDRISESFSAFESYDAHQALHKVKQKIREKDQGRKLQIQSFMKYAAVIAIPLLLGGLMYYLSPAEELQPKMVHNIEGMPGTSRALLYLTDGESVVLEEAKEEHITEKDGTRIRMGNKTLTYEEKIAEMEEVKEQYNVIVTPRGGEYEVLLSDGTKVKLNADSRLKYPIQFLGKERKVELEGEGYFEVVKNPNRPFIVSTYGSDVRVLGTSFNIMAYKDEDAIETTLVEGSVKLKSKNSLESVLLKPGFKADLKKNGNQFSVKEVDVFVYTAWKDGRFVFNNEPLESIMRKIARWYDVKIFYQNPKVKNYRFSARLKRYDQLESLLGVIEMTQKVKIKRQNNTLIVYENLK